MKKRHSFIGQILIGAFCVIGLSGDRLDAAQNNNPILHIGIEQRFGENPQDKLVIEATSGDQLRLNFVANDGTTRQNLNTNKIEVALARAPLTQPVLDEKLVLSHHRSYENAAASAYRWQAQGIETEIVQPRRWQVWAKRSTYDTRLLRHLLLYNLHAQGHTVASVNGKILRDRPMLSWVVGNYRYNRNTLDISTGKGLIKVNNKLFAGTLRLQQNVHNSYTLVNHVPLETYLRGVVPHEIGYGAPYEAVKAQAVLARTYVLASRHRFVVDGYHLCADTQCQVYRGLEGTSNTADNAIAATRGQVLIYDGRVVDALYSSTTGGVTADYNDLWDGQDRPYLESVIDSVNNAGNLSKFNLSQEQDFRTFLAQRETVFNEKGWHTFRWEKESNLSEIKTTLQKFLRQAGDTQTRFNTIKDLQVIDRAASGRVLKVGVQTDKGTIVLEKDEIMDALYAPNSTLFYVDPVFDPNFKTAEGEKVVKGYKFTGGGLGHGVGMSQTGSYHLGDLGWSYDRILNFYYTNVQLQPLRPEYLADVDLKLLEFNPTQGLTTLNPDLAKPIPELANHAQEQLSLLEPSPASVSPRD
ncbi:SpoIID/LytB domain-containing protein [Thalassoporum mexicanum]